MTYITEQDRDAAALRIELAELERKLQPRIGSAVWHDCRTASSLLRSVSIVEDMQQRLDTIGAAAGIVARLRASTN